MTKQEIVNTIAQGGTVYWSNKGYIVSIKGNELYVKFIHNGYMTGLHDSELKDCFVEG